MKFKVIKGKKNKFKSGLRGFFKYKNLGIEDATLGDYGANIIRAINGKQSQGEWHYHKLKFQMVYILNGWIKFEYKGKGVYSLEKGDVVYQPPEIHHREIKHSKDLELIEITSPANFETITL